MQRLRSSRSSLEFSCVLGHTHTHTHTHTHKRVHSCAFNLYPWMGKKKDNLNCLAEVLRLFWVFKRICTNNHYIEGYTTWPNISNLFVINKSSVRRSFPHIGGNQTVTTKREIISESFLWHMFMELQCTDAEVYATLRDTFLKRNKESDSTSTLPSYSFFNRTSGAI